MRAVKKKAKVEKEAITEKLCDGMREKEETKPGGEKNPHTSMCRLRF